MGIVRLQPTAACHKGKRLEMKVVSPWFFSKQTKINTMSATKAEKAQFADELLRDGEALLKKIDLGMAAGTDFSDDDFKLFIQLKNASIASLKMAMTMASMAADM